MMSREEAFDKGAICTECKRGIDWYPANTFDDTWLPLISCLCENCCSYDSVYMYTHVTHQDYVEETSDFKDYADMPCGKCRKTVRELMTEWVSK